MSIVIKRRLIQNVFTMITTEYLSTRISHSQIFSRARNDNVTPAFVPNKHFAVKVCDVVEAAENCENSNF